MIIEAGLEVTDRQNLPQVTPADVERLLEVAPKYGVEIKPPN